MGYQICAISVFKKHDITSPSYVEGMNRPIKFRAWGGGEIKYFVYFDLFSERGEDYFIDQQRQPDGSQHILSFSDVEATHEFTGLHDKNGKEIYEGDIVTLGNEYYVVSWDAFFGLWQLGSPTEGVPYLKLGRANERLEIVGNIYENPDLLTV